jgi:hypothetical protein
MANKLSPLDDNLFFNNNQINRMLNKMIGIAKLLESVPRKINLPDHKYIKLINTVYGYHYETNLNIDDLAKLDDIIVYRRGIISLLNTIECYPGITFMLDDAIIDLDDEISNFSIRISHYSNKNNRLNSILEDTQFDDIRCNFYEINMYCSCLNYDISKKYSEEIYSRFKMLISAFEDLDIKVSVLLSRSIFYVLVNHFTIIGSFVRFFKYSDLENNNFEYKIIEMLSGIRNKDAKEMIVNTARLEQF